MMTNPIGGLDTMNAAYNWMSAANSLMNLSFRGGSGSPTTTDKNLTLNMLNDSFNYKANSAIADTQQKLAKEKAKRSFSVFA